MRRRFYCLVIAALVLTFSPFSGQGLAEDGPDACLVFTQSDASDLFQENVSPGVARVAASPAGSNCRYAYTRDGEAYGLSLVYCTDATIAQEGIHDSAADVMARQLRARKNSPAASGLLEIIPGLGDEAFWDGTALWMRKAGHLVRIAPSPHLAGSFADMNAANAAKAGRSRELALQAGEVILSRLP